MHRDSQERACRGDVVGRGVFGKIFERGERSGIFLHFIEDDERCMGLYGTARFDPQSGQKAPDVQIRRKERRHSFIRLKIDIGDIFV